MVTGTGCDRQTERCQSLRYNKCLLLFGICIVDIVLLLWIWGRDFFTQHSTCYHQRVCVPPRVATHPRGGSLDISDCMEFWFLKFGYYVWPSSHGGDIGSFRHGGVADRRSSRLLAVNCIPLKIRGLGSDLFLQIY